MHKDFEFYKRCLESLNTMKRCGKPAPHKALLLLSVIDLIEQGIIVTNRIQLTDELERQFKNNVQKFIGQSILFKPKVNYPYYHMQSEPFWQLISHSNGKVEAITNYSINNLRNNIAYAMIDKELFELLKNPNVRAKLRVVLISSYLNNQPTLADNLPVALLAIGYFTSFVA